MAAGAVVLATQRLALRRLTLDDAAFARELVNDPDWLRFIGDRGVRTLDDARAYLAKVPIAMYERCGFGLWLVERLADGVALGICGLVKRDTLPEVDLGFALLARHRGKGYAREAALAVLDFARDEAGLGRLLAITVPGNRASIRLLERLGFRYQRTLALPGDPEPVSLYGIALAVPGRPGARI